MKFSIFYKKLPIIIFLYLMMFSCQKSKKISFHVEAKDNFGVKLPGATVEINHVEIGKTNNKGTLEKKLEEADFPEIEKTPAQNIAQETKAESPVLESKMVDDKEVFSKKPTEL